MDEAITIMARAFKEALAPIDGKQQALQNENFQLRQWVAAIEISECSLQGENAQLRQQLQTVEKEVRLLRQMIQAYEERIMQMEVKQVEAPPRAPEAASGESLSASPPNGNATASAAPAQSSTPTASTPTTTNPAGGASSSRGPTPPPLPPTSSSTSIPRSANATTGPTGSENNDSVVAENTTAETPLVTSSSQPGAAGPTATASGAFGDAAAGFLSGPLLPMSFTALVPSPPHSPRNTDEAIDQALATAANAESKPKEDTSTEDGEKKDSPSQTSAAGGADGENAPPILALDATSTSSESSPSAASAPSSSTPSNAPTPPTTSMAFTIATGAMGPPPPSGTKSTKPSWIPVAGGGASSSTPNETTPNSTASGPGLDPATSKCIIEMYTHAREGIMEEEALVRKAMRTVCHAVGLVRDFQLGAALKYLHRERAQKQEWHYVMVETKHLTIPTGKLRAALGLKSNQFTLEQTMQSLVNRACSCNGQSECLVCIGKDVGTDGASLISAMIIKLKASYEQWRTSVFGAIFDPTAPTSTVSTANQQPPAAATPSALPTTAVALGSRQPPPQLPPRPASAAPPQQPTTAPPILSSNLGMMPPSPSTSTPTSTTSSSTGPSSIISALARLPYQTPSQRAQAALKESQQPSNSQPSPPPPPEKVPATSPTRPGGPNPPNAKDSRSGSASFQASPVSNSSSDSSKLEGGLAMYLRKHGK